MIIQLETWERRNLHSPPEPTPTGSTAIRPSDSSNAEGKEIAEPRSACVRTPCRTWGNLTGAVQARCVGLGCCMWAFVYSNLARFNSSSQQFVHHKRNLSALRVVPWADRSHVIG